MSSTRCRRRCATLGDAAPDGSPPTRGPDYAERMRGNDSALHNSGRVHGSAGRHRAGSELPGLPALPGVGCIEGLRRTDKPLRPPPGKRAAAVAARRGYCASGQHPLHAARRHKHKEMCFSWCLTAALAFPKMHTPWSATRSSITASSACWDPEAWVWCTTRTIRNSIDASR